MRGADRRQSGAASSIGIADPRAAAGRAGAADRGRGRRARMERGRSCIALCRRAWPYRVPQARRSSMPSSRMLAEGFTTRRGRRGALIHRDAVNGVLRGRRGARLTALTSGGTIPDNADYQVVLEPQSLVIGTVNEDFAVESLAGDVFQLGNTAYRILRVERGLRARRRCTGQRRRPFRSGWAKRPGAATNSRLPSRAFDASWPPASSADPTGATALRWLVDRARRWRGSAACQLVEYLAAAAGRARLLAHAQDHRARALLRRSRRHAAGHAFALRQPHQSRLGPGAAQALLPQIQFRAAGGGDRGLHRPFADDGAQLRARRGCALSPFRQRRATS